MEPMEIDLDCAICGQSAGVTDLDPVRLEHVIQVWRDVHEHTADERATWRDAMAAAMREVDGE